jgi:hypothetical protein
LNASGANGSVVLNGAIGNTLAIGSLSARASNITLNGGQLKTTGSQTFAGAVTLGAGTTLTASNVTTTAGSRIAGAGNSLNVTGNAYVGGDVSAVSVLNVSGTTQLNANISTTGNQTYAGAMTVATNANLAASGNSAVITVGSNLDGDTAATRTLNISATGTGAKVVSGRRSRHS